jgi:hypothetical protein
MGNKNQKLKTDDCQFLTILESQIHMNFVGVIIMTTGFVKMLQKISEFFYIAAFSVGIVFAKIA